MDTLTPLDEIKIADSHFLGFCFPVASTEDVEACRNKLKQIQELSNGKDVLRAVDMVKPPIFWKDKPHILEQAKKWDRKRINKAVKKTFELEKKIKTDATINKSILVKKFLVDICLLANS